MSSSKIVTDLFQEETSFLAGVFLLFSFQIFLCQSTLQQMGSVMTLVRNHLAILKKSDIFASFRVVAADDDLHKISTSRHFYQHTDTSSSSSSTFHHKYVIRTIPGYLPTSCGRPQITSRRVGGRIGLGRPSTHYLQRHELVECFRSSHLCYDGMHVCVHSTPRGLSPWTISGYLFGIARGTICDYLLPSHTQIYGPGNRGNG
jgi:hypothetical protein